MWKPAESPRLLSRSRKSSQVGCQDRSSVSVSPVDTDPPHPSPLCWIFQIFSRFYLQIWIFFSDQLIIVNTERFYRRLRCWELLARNAKKVFCLHWCFIGIHTQECLLITLFNHRVQIIWYFLVCFNNWVLCINLFRFILYCFYAPPPPPAQLGPLCFLLSDRIHVDILPVSGVLLLSTPEPVRQTSKSRGSRHRGFSGGGPLLSSLCVVLALGGGGPFKWQQYYGCLKRTIAGNRFVFLVFNQDAITISRFPFCYCFLLPWFLVSVFCVNMENMKNLFPSHLRLKNVSHRQFSVQRLSSDLRVSTTKLTINLYLPE